jgi:hypothetical protein
MSMKKRASAAGVVVALAAGYAWGRAETTAPGTTDATLTDIRVQGATVAGHAVGAGRDVIAIAGPAVAEVGGMAGAAGGAAATEDPLADTSGG